MTIKNLLEKDLKVFRKAYEIAEAAHKDQKRKDGKPYMTHIDGVILNVCKYHEIDEDSIIGEHLENILATAALHDVAEDASHLGYTLPYLETYFEDDVVDADQK